ncbi:MAG TPA: polysaccharide deacetylase family protein [Rhizomicrobium sp.]|nr:polysaccharide deacetylase family protein [Rhizomicrobium sp.]
MPLLAVNHHYYRSVSTGKGIYPTTPEALAVSVCKIRDAGWTIINQTQLLDYLAGRRPAAARVCVLTFDDGLKEQIEAVKHLLDMDACAICFVPTAPLLDHVVLDVHKLQMIRSVMDDAELAARLDQEFSFGTYAFDENLLAIQYRYDEPLSRKVKYYLNFVLTEAQRGSLVNELFAALFGDERAAAATLYMDTDDLKWLAGHALFGSHGHAHLPLATLESDHLQAELSDSFEVLTRLAGAPPVGISYPYGGASAVSKAVFDRSRQVGYRYGFTMERGITPDPTSLDMMALRRIDTNDLDKWLADG